MILYHGFNVTIMNPDIVHSRKHLDFGCGFYVTPLREQAEKWVEKFMRFGETGIADMHCMSEWYLVEDLEKEYQETME